MNAEPIAAGWNELGRGVRNSNTIPVDLRELLARTSMSLISEGTYMLSRLSVLLFSTAPPMFGTLMSHLRVTLA